ncbi:MAG: hypothetical protein ACREID_07385, partial [Planctomycetota bacterium]
MKRRQLRLLCVVPLLAACANPPPSLAMRLETREARPPSAIPVGYAVEPRLLPYPGTQVFRVANAGGEVYFLDGVYYCFHDGNWFAAEAVRGPWLWQEMKRVPADLFRVRGQLPP